MHSISCDILGFCACVCCKESHLHHEVGANCVLFEEYITLNIESFDNQTLGKE